jgi:hypothetical protein
MVALRASLVNAVLPLSNDNCAASNLVRRATGMGRLRQFGSSHCRRTASVRCRSGLQNRERQLSRIAAFERRATYGGCTLKPVTGVPIS